MDKQTNDLGAPFKAIEADNRHAVEGRFLVIRADGHGFSKWTRGLDRPYDHAFTEAMTRTAEDLGAMIPQTLCVYVVSDELSVVIDYGDSPLANQWFCGNVAKIVSLTAARATAIFNRHMPDRGQPAIFDARVFPLDDAAQVLDYLNWRRADGVRNAVSSAARAYFSPSQLDKVSHEGRLAMLEEAGHPVTELPDGFVRGRVAYRRNRFVKTAYQDKRSGEWNEVEAMRSFWESDDAVGNFSDIIGLRPGD